MPSGKTSIQEPKRAIASYSRYSDTAVPAKKEEAMDKVWWWVIDIILPVALLIALVWLVFLRGSNRTDRTTYEATKREYAEEERRRREGTDDL
jgi:hypothetical protein